MNTGIRPGIRQMAAFESKTRLHQAGPHHGAALSVRSVVDRFFVRSLPGYRRALCGLLFAAAISAAPDLFVESSDRSGPKADDVLSDEIDLPAARRFWAYQPIRNPSVPSLPESDWPSS